MNNSHEFLTTMQGDIRCLLRDAASPMTQSQIWDALVESGYDKKLTGDQIAASVTRLQRAGELKTGKDGRLRTTYELVADDGAKVEAKPRKPAAIEREDSATVPSGLQAQVLAHIAGRKEWFSRKALAEALRIAPEKLTYALQQLTQQGALIAFGATSSRRYALPGTEPEAAPAPQQRAASAMPAPKKRASKKPRKAAKSADAAAEPPLNEPAIPVFLKRANDAVANGRRCRFAAWDDGSLLIEQQPDGLGVQRLTLSPEDVGHLRQFIARAEAAA